jgi:sulfate permease, SulP family
MLLIGVLRLGKFFSYLPQSVIGAFMSGLGVIITASQLKAILGIKTQPSPFDLGVIDDLWVVLCAADQSDPRTLAIAGVVIGVIFLLPKLNGNIPASLAGVLLASIAAHLFGWQLPKVGTLPDSLPVPSANDLVFSASLIYPALTLAGLITINQLLTVVVTDRFNEGSGGVKFNRELAAQGIANIACPFFGAPPGVAMLARSIASAKAGAVSRWSVLAHSLVLLLFLLPLRNLISRIPLAARGIERSAAPLGAGVYVEGEASRHGGPRL